MSDEETIYRCLTLLYDVRYKMYVLFIPGKQKGSAKNVFQNRPGYRNERNVR